MRTNAINLVIAHRATAVRHGIRAWVKSIRSCKVVGETGKAAELFPLIEQARPRVVVLDDGLPEALKMVRQATGQYMAKVVVMFEHDQPGIVPEMLRAGASGFFAMGSGTEETFKKAVLLAAAGERYFTPGLEELARARKPLTRRELEIVKLIVSGEQNKQIADILGLSVKTVDAHRTNLLHKLDLHSAAEIASFALRQRLVTV